MSARFSRASAASTSAWSGPGMRVVWQCEQDDFCRRVLAKHWPDVPCYEDVRELTGGDVEQVDVICAGWPCPGFSVAGLGQGFDHEGSGLWSEVIRLVRELRPRYVVLENVAALLGRGVGRVFGDLAACGYDAEWDCIPASAVGAPHRRDRLWVVAYPQREGLEGFRVVAGEPEVSEPRDRGALADADRAGQEHLSQGETGRWLPGGRERDDPSAGRSDQPGGSAAGWWAVEPDVGRVAHGVPARVDRLRSLGNSLVPQIAEWIGRRILEAEEVRAAA